MTNSLIVAGSQSSWSQVTSMDTALGAGLLLATLFVCISAIFIRKRNIVITASLIWCAVLVGFFAQSWRDEYPTKTLPPQAIYRIQSPEPTRVDVVEGERATIANVSDQPLRIVEMRIDELSCPDGGRASDLIIDCRPGETLLPNERCHIGCKESVVADATGLQPTPRS